MRKSQQGNKGGVRKEGNLSVIIQSKGIKYFMTC